MRQKVVKTTYRSEIIKGYTEMEGDLLKLTLANKKWPLITYPYNQADYDANSEDVVKRQNIIAEKLIELYELAQVLSSESQTKYIVNKYYEVFSETQNTLVNKQEYEILKLKLPTIKGLSQTERNKLLVAINDSYHSFRAIRDATITEVFNNGQRRFSNDLFTQFLYLSETNISQD
jgi:hypothetical protein